MSGRPRVTVALGLVLSAAIIVLETVPGTRTPESVATAALNSLMNLAFVWAGAVGLVLRPRTLLGPAMMAVGLTSAVGNLVFSESSAVAYTLGLLTIGLFTAPLSHALLAYPGGRLTDRGDRFLVAATYGHLTIQWWVFATFHEPGPGDCARCGPDANLVAVAPDAGTYDVLLGIQALVSVVLALLVVRRLRARWRQAGAVGRRVLGPVLVGGIVCASVVVLTTPFAYATVSDSTGSLLLHAGWLVGFGAIPVGYTTGLVRDAVRRARLAALLIELENETDPDDVRRAVRDALGDARADVLRAGPAGPRTLTGVPAAVADDQVARPLGDGAVLVHDPALLQDAELVPAVARAVSFALENRRLREDLVARLDEIDAARGRLVRAEAETRRAIERDLHDGVQQTLVSLRLLLRLVDEDALDPDSAEALDEARVLAGAAATEVRDLAHGVYPAVLVADGLPGGLGALADRAGVHVQLDVDVPRRSRPELEAAAYFCAREAITNVVKHAGVAACVCVVRVHGEVLELVVRDEGRGGATVARGLRGLVDRAEAVGGTLRVDSPPDGGTRLTVRLPWPARPARDGGRPVTAARRGT